MKRPFDNNEDEVWKYFLAILERRIRPEVSYIKGDIDFLKKVRSVIDHILQGGSDE